jgi:hypothetical protein
VLPAAGILRRVLGAGLRPVHDKTLADAQQIGDPGLAVADLEIQIAYLAAQIIRVLLSIRRFLLSSQCACSTIRRMEYERRPQGRSLSFGT